MQTVLELSQCWLIYNCCDFLPLYIVRKLSWLVDGCCGVHLKRRRNQGWSSPANSLNLCANSGGAVPQSRCASICFTNTRQTHQPKTTNTLSRDCWEKQTLSLLTHFVVNSNRLKRMLKELLNVGAALWNTCTDRCGDGRTKGMVSWPHKHIGQVPVFICVCQLPRNHCTTIPHTLGLFSEWIVFYAAIIQ